MVISFQVFLSQTRTQAITKCW